MEAQRGVLEIKLRTKPRISMNKLAEFAVEASSYRRRGILADQIVERPFKRGTYEHGRKALARFLGNPSSQPDQLLRVAEGFRDQAALTPDNDLTEKRALICSARALEAFRLIAGDFRVKNAVVSPGGRGTSELNWAGVPVSVRPDICFLRPGTEQRIGALKLHFSVEGRLDSKALKYAATILRAYLLEQGEVPKPALCIAVDVMAMEQESAPKGMKAILKDLQASCRDIAVLWPSILAEEKAKAELKAKVRLI